MHLAEARQSSSFLVRVWPELREAGGQAPLRVYVRDLRTGEEHYLADPGEIGRFVARQALAARRESDHETSRANDGEAGRS